MRDHLALPCAHLFGVEFIELSDLIDRLFALHRR